MRTDIDITEQSELYLARKRASADLADIEALRNQPATDRYLLRRAREIRDQHADAVLHNDQLVPEEREKRRQLYLAFKDFALILDTDEAAHRQTLEDQTV